MTSQSLNDQMDEFDRLLDTLVQRSGVYCRSTPRQPPLDDLHRTIHLDDPIRTHQVRVAVARIERVLVR